MEDYSHFLLYTDSQVQQFRTEFASLIETNREKYREWVESLDYDNWYSYIPYGCQIGKVRFIVGLLCILYIDGDINIVFKDRTADKIRRNPNNPEFWEQMKLTPNNI